MASLAEMIEEAARFRSSFAFMLVGIDHLARINDAFGHDVADGVILEVARRICVHACVVATSLGASPATSSA